MDIEVKILDKRLSEWGFPTYGSDLAAGLDLFACVESPLLLLPQDPPKLVSVGLAVRIGDPNWCGLILPRSGAGHSKGLILGNAIGVVDPDYTGPCLISAWNRNPPLPEGGHPVRIDPGDRIAQLLIVRVVRPNWKVVDVFSEETERGGRGFGSSGS